MDFPAIMEPDVHSFVGSKLGWIGLPENARTSEGQFEYQKMWPKSSLKRLEVCLEKFEAAKKRAGVPDRTSELSSKEKDGSLVDDDGEKTPTTTEDVEGIEDTDAFEIKFKETERALQERLAKLSLKLEN